MSIAKESLCAAPKLVASPAGPVDIGTSVLLSGSASCAVDETAEFRFYARAPGAAVKTLVRDWGGASATWSTLGLAPGRYDLTMQVRHAPTGIDGGASLAFYVGDVCSTAPSLSVTPAGPSAVGTLLRLSAQATCRGAAVPEFRFAYVAPGASMQSEICGWGAGTCDFPTESLADGHYALIVYVRAEGNASAYEARRTASHGLGDVCNAITVFSANPAPPQEPGTSVSLIAEANCTGGTPEYLFRMKRPGSTALETLCSYGTGSCPLDTRNFPSGRYTLYAYARAQGNLSASESARALTYDVSDVCNVITSFAATPGSPVDVNTSVSLGATASCTGGSPDFLFRLKRPGSTTFETLCGFGAGLCTWNTDGYPSGRYTLKVDTRANGNASTTEGTKSMTFDLGPVCSKIVSVGTSPLSPRPVGTSVALSAEATCNFGGTPEFRFAARRSDAKTWMELCGYGIDPCVWRTDDLPPGKYVLATYARAQGNASVSEGGKTTSFVLEPIIPPPNPVPVISSISPASGTAGGDAFTLSVSGSDFVPASVVNFRGAPLPTTFVSSTALTAEVPASAIAAPGTYPVAVTNPSPGGGTSGRVDYLAAEQTCESHAIKLTSAAARVSIPNTGFGVGTGDWTVEFWLRLHDEFPRASGDTNEWIFGTNEAYSTYAVGLGIWTYEPNVVFCHTYKTTGPSGVRVKTSNINDGRWHHIACQYSAASGGLAMYTDGVLTQSAAGSVDLRAQSTTVIGKRSGYQEFVPPALIGPLRFSKVARYPGSFSPSTVWGVDGDTVAQYLTTTGLFGGVLPDEAGGDNDGTVDRDVVAESCGTAVCGNGLVEDLEQCDDGNAVTETCAYGESSCTVCNATCRSVEGATSYCGDGRTDPDHGETCDDGNRASGDGCSDACQIELSCGPSGSFDERSAQGGREALASWFYDLDRDGFPDIIWVNQLDNELVIYWGDGTGLLSLPPSHVSVGRSGGGASFGDVDRDGVPDILVTNQDYDRLVLVRGRGGRAFGSQEIISQSGFPDTVELADVNGDGVLDAVVGLRRAGCTTVRMGDGLGGFAAGSCLASVLDNAQGGDLDIDGRAELVSPNADSIELYRYVDGDVTRILTLALPQGHTSARSPDFVDLDGDGDLDIVTGCLSPSGAPTIVVYHQEAGVFSPCPFGSASTGPNTWIRMSGMGDLNRDGLPDWSWQTTCSFCSSTYWVGLGRASLERIRPTANRCTDECVRRPTQFRALWRVGSRPRPRG